MPSANSFRVCFSILAARCSCIILPVRFSTRVSRSMPSMISSGSSTLPLDLDIFCPLASLTRPCMYTSLNGTCPSINLTPNIIMRATQKNIMSKPVTRTLVGYQVFKASVCSGQPSVENGQRPEENHVSSTSSSCDSGRSAASLYFLRASSSLSAT